MKTGTRAPVGRDRVALRPTRVALAWLAAVAVDLFLNAGLLSPLLEQSREPSLLADDALVRRIPVAFALLALAVTALAWLLERTGLHGRRAVALGGIAGVVLGLVGVGGLWTAVDITGAFVAGGVVVAGAEGGVAAAVLTSRWSRGRLTLVVVSSFVLLALTGQVAANLFGG